MLWRKVIAQQLMSFTIVLNKMMLNRRAFFAGGGHFTLLILIGSITRGGNVVNADEKL